MNKLYNKTLHVFKNVMREEDEEILTTKTRKFYSFFIIDKKLTVFMKNMIIVFYLCFLPFAFVYSQSRVDSICNSNMENIFKVHILKMKYETVQYIYEKHGFLYVMGKTQWNEYFRLIRGFPIFEEQHDSISVVNSENGKLASVKRLSEEEMNGYIEQLNCTPEKALQEYKDFIRTIKSEKEIYLKCIDAELAKGDLSEYANEMMPLYNFLSPGSSLLPLPLSITKLNFLNVFKEFILNGNEEVLPKCIS